MHFSAETIADALAKVRQTLGEDASIVNIRQLKRGGVRGREVVEVTAMPPDTGAAEHTREPSFTEADARGPHDVPHQPLMNQRETADNTGREYYAGPSERDVLNALTSESEGREAGRPLFEEASGKGPRSVALVGPAGGGKTTLAAKLAYNTVAHGAGVPGLVSTDYCGFRGTDILEAYARTMRCEFCLAFTAEEVNRVVKDLMDSCPLIVFDAPGINHNVPHELERLQNLFRLTPGIEKHLVVPATGSTTAMLSWFSQYVAIGVDAVAVTHLDEIDDVGCLFAALEVYDVPLSFLSTGRSVTGNLDVADKEFLKELTIGARKREQEDSQVA
jgi:flagellar biosynthesis GTPase FlhF